MENRFRIIILGAGFSKPAGLPLGIELFKSVRERLKSLYGSDNAVEADLERYRSYLYRCEGVDVGHDAVDYELFLGFLDAEHYLGLKGKDTWSREGNESQLLVRDAIARVLLDAKPNEPLHLYRRFVQKLTPTDTIYTFKYDTLVEDACVAEGVKYSLLPHHLQDSSGESCITICKLHGSVDWFDKSNYLYRFAYSKKFDPPYRVKHPIFDDAPIVFSEQLFRGQSGLESEMEMVHRVRDYETVLNYGPWSASPLILAPSHSKLYYSKPLKDLWWGLQRVGGLSLGLSVIGYSLPKYDMYARQALYHIFRNYQYVEPHLESNGVKKGPAKILDFQPPGDSGGLIRASYRFANWDYTALNLQGLNETTLDWVLE